MFSLEQIKKIQLENLSTCVHEEEFKNYFLGEPGVEHYKLLAYISNTYSDTLLLDVGSYKGCSALALAYNKENRVISFDLVDKVELEEYPLNIQFVVDDITKHYYTEYILKSPFIFLDTNHDGIFENTFYNLLDSLKWKGTLMLDDIYLNTEMKKFWNNIDREKYDISDVGHHSGTGIVKFN